MATQSSPSAQLTPGQRAYEEKRAAKAGLSLDKWLVAKEKQQAAENAPPKVKKPGFFTKLIDKAHQPIKKK